MIKWIHSGAPGGTAGRTLLVMLPGAGIDAAAFAERGMVAAVQRRGLVVDIVAAQPALELYLDGSVAHALHRGIVEPALAEGYARLWLLGISLGGMGALLYVSRHAALAEGLVLLAPFLGTQGTIAAIAAAGGFASRSAPDAATTATEGRMLAWLRDFLRNRPPSPRLYLGYGRADRFARGHRMLADRLPADHVVVEEGAHDWDTWLSLWHRVLDAAPFTASPGEGR
jgi:pimeloyl-ACP methyl ester carboxylesterase